MFFNIAIIIQILFIKVNSDSPSLTISRSKAHIDKSGSYTPLVVSLSTEDKNEKMKPVDLICIVDVSGSMSGAPINLVKESLNYLVKLMNDTDNFALVTFSSNSQIVNNLTIMTEENKNVILGKIQNLRASGGTNIYSGLEKGLQLLKNDYSSGDRIASMILLSDGDDNYNYDKVDNLFEDLLVREGKKDYVFTLYSFGYGSFYDYSLMNNISLIKDGAYFNIDKLSDVNDAFLKIYGSLSTVSNVNVQLKIQSNFNIIKVYGIEDMHEANMTSDTFNVKLIQVVYGKKYNFVLLVDIPKNTPNGTEVLNATVSSLGLKAKYIWNENYSPAAYEEYIRCIVVIIFIDGYNSQLISILEKGIEWIIANYKGMKNWIKEFNGAIEDLKSTGKKGKANLLSKITELKTSRIGIHYDEGNSYQRELIDNSHGIDVSKMEYMKIEGTKIINFRQNINYYYFYLKDGIGEINNLPFSGKSSSLVIYSNDTSGNINITSLSDSMECYFWNESSTSRIQTVVDFNRVGKFNIKKNFPFDFYTRVDGKRDITFNIEFLKLDRITNINIGDLLEINAYILTDDEIDDLAIDTLSLTGLQVFNSTFDNNLKSGKIVLKKEDISYNLNSIFNNYLYVIIKTSSHYNIAFNSVEGQFLFLPTDYVYSSVPENYYIFSNLEIGGNTPHLYTLEIDPSSKNKFIIEFDNFGEELDFKILNYQNYVDNIIDYYNDYDKYIVEKTNNSNKMYANITQSKEINTTFDKVILSIFSSNKEHIAGSNIQKLSYRFKYKADYYEEEIQETTKTTVILLGFARFAYIKNFKICYFFVYFVYIEQIDYSKEIIITTYITYIQYANRLRGLQENVPQKSVCKLVENEFDNQKRYNCTLETDGEDIENIQIDRNITSENKELNVSDIDVSPIGSKYINNVQEVGDSDPFEKKLYILDNSKVVVDRYNNEFNITGSMKESGFNYTNFNLELTLSTFSKEQNENVSCISIDEGENKYTLKCSTENDLKGHLKSAFSDLENGNLLVNFLGSAKRVNLNFDKTPNLAIKNKSSGGLSTGGIIAIIVSCVIILIAVTLIVIFGLKRKPRVREEFNTVSNVSSTTNNNANPISSDNNL